MGELSVVTQPPDNSDPRAVMAMIWERNRDDAVARLVVLEDAVAALIENRLPEQMRRAAEREAHRLAGSAGTFGFLRASEAARQLERIFSGTEPVPVDSVFKAADEVVALRADLGRDVTLPTANEDETGTSGTTAAALKGLVVAVAGERRRSKIAAAAVARGFQAILIEFPGQMPTWDEPPVAALVDLGFAGTGGTALIASLGSASPAIPSLALTAGDALSSRVEAVRAGAQEFLAATAPIGEQLDAVVRMLSRSGGSGTVVVADDDPAILAAVGAVLATAGLRTVGVEDPSRFWTVLEDEQPDLVILDLDMPGIRGDELCRVIRGDARWSGLPILFLTANRDVGTVGALFTAGADDFVQKPFDGPELLARVTNRLDRTRLPRAAAGTSPPTGPADRRQAEPEPQVPLDPSDRPVDVVIVEDDSALAELLAHALGTRGYGFRHLSDGREAADQLAGNAPALRGRVVLLDVDLPTLNGFGVLREMAAAGQLLNTRVIMLTARALEG